LIKEAASNPFLITGNSACYSKLSVRFDSFSCFSWSRT